MTKATSEDQQYDAIVVGAGFSGLYAIYKLRELGLRVCALEAGSGVGGTWYWNRYPGARTDSQSHVYQYWFSPELLAEWDWSQRFPAQEETERYLNFVADKFELRPHIRLNTRVVAADFDEPSQRWTVTTEGGDELNAQFFIMGTGGLTEPVLPDIPGIDSFEGESHHTARWPQSGVDFAGKRVGIIGTGATGVQVIQTIAKEVGHLTVFQRTPNYAMPMDNPDYDDAARDRIRAQYPELKERVRNTFAGFDYDFEDREFLSLSPETRRERLEELWADGSLRFWIGSFAEMLVDEKVNNEFTEFVREKIRARIDDPEVAAKLVPSTYQFGTRRVPLESGYYEAFNRDNVDLVDVSAAPIEAITPTGVRTASGEFPLDILIFATGFDAGTGALTRVEIRGREGQVLRDAWDNEIRSFMGLQIHGYPNLFTTMAPLAPVAAFCNVPTCLQQQIDWITDCIAFVRNRNVGSIEPSKEAQDAWVAHHDEVAEATLVMKTGSWYVRRDAAGKPERLLPYAGGAHTYRQLCDNVKASDYEGMVVRPLEGDQAQAS